MGCFAEAGYLASIILLEEGITSQERAIAGHDIVDYVKVNAPVYFDFLGAEKLKKRLLVPLVSANCPYDPEHPLTDDPSYADLARDTVLNFDDPNLNYPEVLYTSKYWMHNSDRKGVSFESGIEEELIAIFFRETKKDRAWYVVERMEDIEDDVDLWAFVNTWLERNWR